MQTQTIYSNVIWDITNAPIVICTQEYKSAKERARYHKKLKIEYKFDNVLVIMTDIIDGTYNMIESPEKATLVKLLGI